MNIIFKMIERMLYSGSTIILPKSIRWKTEPNRFPKKLSLRFKTKDVDSSRWGIPAYSSNKYTHLIKFHKE